MTTDPSWTPPLPPPARLEADLERLLTEIEQGRAPLGEKLLVLGRGRPPIPGALGGAVAVAANGDLVLIVGFQSLEAPTAPAIADQLDRLATVTSSGLDAVSPAPMTEEQLFERHTSFFSETVSPDATPAPFNSSQRVVLLVREEPSLDVWQALVIELGKMLGGLWRLGDGDESPVALELPTELRRSERKPSGVPFLSILGALIVLFGVVLGVLALTRAADEPPPAPPNAVEPPVRDVAFDVSSEATHSQWIGQQRLLRTSDGKLVVLYPGENGLQVVSDQKNQARSWRSPATFPEIVPLSLSAAIDDDDNVHIAFTDGSGVSYARLEATARGWDDPVVLSLDEGTESPVVDIAWDPGAEHAYVVWAAQSEDGESPNWGVVAEEEGTLDLVETGELAEPAEDIPVLANVAVDSRSFIHVTYRRGDAPTGWYGQSGTIGSDGRVTWGSEERLPTDAGFGAASLAVDQRGVAHLILRDSTSYALLYFRRAPRGEWSSPQVALDAESIEEIDFPTLSLDASSKLVYLFFQTNSFNPENEIGLVVRDPVSGWETPYRIAATPGGAHFPTTMALNNGQPIVLWTTGGATPSIQAARVIAP